MEEDISEEDLVLLVTPYTPEQVAYIRQQESLSLEQAYAIMAETLEKDPGLNCFYADVEQCARTGNLSVLNSCDDGVLLIGEPENLQRAARELNLRRRDANVMTYGEFLASQENAFDGETPDMQYQSSRPN